MAWFIGRNGILFAGLCLLPLAFGDFWAYQLGLYFLYAIAALGVGICWGRAGFLPLGQAMFLGIGAYLSGFALIHFPNSWWLLLLLPAAALVPGALAFLIGLLVFRGRFESGPYFALITLALSLLTFQVATNWVEVTGGFNGLGSIPGLPGIGGFETFYYVIALALMLSTAMVAWLMKSPIGVIWRGISENERRLSYFGYNTPILKALAFGVSGVLGGIAGALYAPHQGLVTPQLTGFMLSAELVIWTAVGGRASLSGPIIGTILVGSLTAELRDTIAIWELMVAGLFIFVVLFMQGGIAGKPELWFRQMFIRPSQTPPCPAPNLKGVSTPPKLEVFESNLSVGSVRILDQLSLNIDHPSIYCLIGPNGAGKTTTFNMVTGSLPMQSGKVVLDGEIVTGLAPYQMTRRGVGRKFQVPSIFPNLTIAENLHSALWGGRCSLLDLLKAEPIAWQSQLLDTLKDRFKFLEQNERLGGALSHGEKQVLELTMALLGEPRLLLLDEPCAGLSSEETGAVMDTIRWLRSSLGTTVVIIEHDMTLVRELADQVIVMNQGRVLTTGSVLEIQSDPRVQEVYIGVSL